MPLILRIPKGVYHGRLVGFLSELNALAPWRELSGRVNPDKRMRDQELLLRFLALLFDAENYQKPMKRFLNNFMGGHRNADDQLLELVAPPQRDHNPPGTRHWTVCRAR